MSFWGSDVEELLLSKERKNPNYGKLELEYAVNENNINGEVTLNDVLVFNKLTEKNNQPRSISITKSTRNSLARFINAVQGEDTEERLYVGYANHSLLQDEATQKTALQVRLCYAIHKPLVQVGNKVVEVQTNDTNVLKSIKWSQIQDADAQDSSNKPCFNVEMYAVS